MQSRVCFSAQIFTSARAYRHRALARTPFDGRPHHTNDLAGSLGLSCVRGARRELTEEGQHQRPMCSVEITIMLWTGRTCRRRRLAMAQAQTCHRSRKCTKVASEPLNRRLFARHSLGTKARLPSPSSLHCHRRRIRVSLRDDPQSANTLSSAETYSTTRLKVIVHDGTP
jgi:hypothetical protein